MLTGRCNCGAIRYEADAEGQSVTYCHCDTCRRVTGSAFNLGVGVPAQSLKVRGEVRGWRNPERPDRDAVREFCPTCGSPMFTRYPNMVFIKAGTLDDPTQVTPTRQIWTEMEVPWSRIPDDLDSYIQDGARVARGLVEVRLAAADDVQGLVQVHVRSWRAAYVDIVPQAHLDALSVESRVEKWQENLQGTAFRTYVAVTGPTVLGFASIGSTRDDDLGPEDAEVSAIYLLPSHWKQGIGRMLWRAITADAAQNDARTISAWVLEDNLSARSFYERMGCSDLGVRKTLQIGGKDLVAIRYTHDLRSSDR